MGFIERRTRAGLVRGLDSGGVQSFLGVRYGADTGGVNRFRPPQPVANWDGVVDATAFAVVAPQRDAGADGVAGALKQLEHPRGGTALEGASIGEDCLRLNIWAPSTSSAPRPVLVWLHGGGFTNGSGNELAFNGDVLAAREDLVVVTVTHRLGVLGFLDLRAADHGGIEGSANAGMLDIVAALRWVHDNIAEFGGDASRVTIAGHSGGAAKVAALLAMPAADGLYRRAIMQSGPVRRFATESQTHPLRDGVLRESGATGLEDLQRMPLERILDAQDAAMRGDLDGASLLGMDRIPGFGPALDPTDLPRDPFDEGVDRSGLELMTGSTSHEMTALLAGNPMFSTQMDENHAIGVLEHLLPGRGADEYAASLQAAPDEPPHLLFARALTRVTFERETVAIAERVSRAGGSVRMYRFEQLTDVLDGMLGACHGLDIPYVFGTVDRSPLTGAGAGRRELSREMMGAWSEFVHGGGARLGPRWGEWSRSTPGVRRFTAG